MKHFETQIRDFSQQFTEQLKCLDMKVGVDNGILGNIFDLYKRRAVIEQEYSDNLLKLTSLITQRNNAENQKRPKWKNYSPEIVLNSLLASTEYTAKAHKHLSDIYGKQITQRVVDMQDDCTRLNKKATDILQRHHTEIIRSLNQLLGKQKHYIKTFNEADEARKRADRAMDQLDREVIRCQEKNRGLEKNPRIKRLKDDYMERYTLFKTKQTDSTVARNKYIIHLVSLKETIDYFYSNELSTIVQCAEYGFHNNLTRLSMNHASCEEALITVHDSINKLFTDTIDKIDANHDTKVFLEAHKSILTLKENLHFTPAKDDNVNKIVKSHSAVQNNLQNMYVRFNTEMSSISKKVDDDKMEIDTLAISLNDLINQSDYDVVDYICNQSQPDITNVRERTTSLPRNGVSENLYVSIQKLLKDNKMKTEANYFQVLESYLSAEINKINMSTKLKNVETVLSNESDEDENQFQKSYLNIQSLTAVIIGMKSKLFGGNLNKYSSDTKEMIPMVVQSCIRLINIYGMHNMGVFRVPGSQIDVLVYKAHFELGNDPLKSLNGNSNDVNLAASILKLYFRELDPPIFDETMFGKIVANYNSVKRDEEAVVVFMKELVSTLARPSYATLKYLLSFISHLAEFSADNCMDILNLAIIFGPCLMPIPEDKSNMLFQYQTIVNHVAQLLITHHETIFSAESCGPIYQRDQQLMSTLDSNDLPSTMPETEKPKLFEGNSIGGGNEVPEMKNLKRNESTRYVRPNAMDGPLRNRRNSDSERHFDVLAVAIVDYQAKSDQELSFHNGDTFLLKKKINEHWWSGHIVKTSDQNAPATVGLIGSAFINIFTQNDLLLDKDSKNYLSSKQGDANLSSPESQRLSEKGSHTTKMSEISNDSDNEGDFSPDENRSLSHSLGNIADLSELGETKSFGSLDNIVDDDEDQLMIKSENEDCKDLPSLNEKHVEEKETDTQSTTDDNVKIRASRSSVTVTPDGVESTDALDEDLKITMLGLKRFGELNVIKHRNTVHIDKSLLASKFLSPINSDHLNLFQVNPSPLTTVTATGPPQSLPNVSEFKMKKPTNFPTFTSSIEMTQNPNPFLPRQIDHTNSLNRSRPIHQDDCPSAPPPIFPKPKMTLKR